MESAGSGMTGTGKTAADDGGDGDCVWCRNSDECAVGVMVLRARRIQTACAHHRRRRQCVHASAGTLDERRTTQA